ncbi:MAG TPA: bifunctional DNA-formamidopyrimidine glycosylase/DNA-(apurinic or apyrimidinic site) lyase [Thermoanaerobaculia bacterium]|nr:bifunctional DNA-formamidopyrimidine glycosylase/DNA-(apurinic or apyrimidinic site) lyase [Thermoanaerobaculia bacterium]
MPELPEVEVLRRSLQRRVIGRRIEHIAVHDERLREPVRTHQLAARLSGRRIVALRRRAKYLLLDVERGNTLVIHLGMSGRVTLVGSDEPREAHEHVAFLLDGGKRLRLRDPRRFGLVFAASTEGLENDRHFAGLGVEPLGPELSGSALASAARGRKAPVKSFLMDGRAVVGLGNIYATESLFRAGIHPRRSVARMSRQSWTELARAIRAVLKQAIEEGGTTLNDFTDGAGKSGYFQVSLAVYGREGDPCPRCGRPVRRIVQSGRASFYCPGCQR